MINDFLVDTNVNATGKFFTFSVKCSIQNREVNPNYKVE